MAMAGGTIGALIAGVLFVFMLTVTQNRWKIDDVLGVWPLHGLCGAWGGIAAGVFGLKAFGGLGGVSLMSQVTGTLLGIARSNAGSFRHNDDILTGEYAWIRLTCRD